MRHLEVTVSNVDELLAAEAYGPGALLRWERASSSAGPWTPGGTALPLIASQTNYDIWDEAGVDSTWYRTRISDALNTTFSSYSQAAGPVTQSVTPIADVRAMVNTSLSDEELQKIIDREEAWLAGRIGQLVGERTNIVHPAPADPIWLTRRTDAVAVSINGEELAADQYVYTPSIGLLRAAPAAGYSYVSWPGPVDLTYTPTDELEVQAAVIELVRLRVGVADSGGMTSETIGTYSYSRTAPADQPTRNDIARSILLPRTATTMRVRSSIDRLYDRAYWPR